MNKQNALKKHILFLNKIVYNNFGDQLNYYNNSKYLLMLVVFVCLINNNGMKFNALLTIYKKIKLSLNGQMINIFGKTLEIKPEKLRKS